MIKKIVYYLFAWLTIPHIIIFLISRNKAIIHKDIESWWKHLGYDSFTFIRGGGVLKLAWLLLFVKEYRNLFYLRVGKKRNIFLYYLPPLSSLYIYTKSDCFGAGTFIQHGFSTIITAERVGENCWINQQVTIGYNNSQKYGYGRPTIGNNVRVAAGAKICGNITVGDNSTIGLNSVIIKDVPEGSTVIPSPMILIREYDKRVNKTF